MSANIPPQIPGPGEYEADGFSAVAGDPAEVYGEVPEYVEGASADAEYVSGVLEDAVAVETYDAEIVDGDKVASESDIATATDQQERLPTRDEDRSHQEIQEPVSEPGDTAAPAAAEPVPPTTREPAANLERPMPGNDEEAATPDTPAALPPEPSSASNPPASTSTPATPKQFTQKSERPVDPDEVAGADLGHADDTSARGSGEIALRPETELDTTGADDLDAIIAGASAPPEVPHAEVEVPASKERARLGVRESLALSVPLVVGHEVSAQRDYKRGSAVHINPANMGPFAIAGAARTGKTLLAQVLGRGIVERGGSMTVISGAKGEEWVDTLAELDVPVRVIDGGDKSLGRLAVALSLFRPVPGYPHHKHNQRITEILTTFGAVGEEGANMYKIGIQESGDLLMALHGRDPHTGERLVNRRSPPTLPRPDESLREQEQRIRKNYEWAMANILEYMRLRFAPNVDGKFAPYLGALGHPVDVLGMLEEPTLNIIDAASMASSPQDIALLMSLYLNAISEAHEVITQRRIRVAMEEHRALLPAERERWVVVEESGGLFQDGEGSFMTDMFIRMVREYVAGGQVTGFIGQSMSVLPPEIRANLSFIAAFNSPEKTDRDAIASVMAYPSDLQEQYLTELSNLPTGYAHLLVRGMRAPVRLLTPWDPEKPVKKGEVADPRLLDRRTMACGELCAQSACEKSVTFHAVELAGEQSVSMASGRVWVASAFRGMMLGTPMGAAPKQFKERYQAIRDLEPQLAECIMTEVVDRVVREHIGGLEQADMPSDLLTTTLATTLRAALDGTIDPGVQVGEEFIPPVMRVLIATEQIQPFEGNWHGVVLRDTDPAPLLLHPIEGVRETVIEKGRHGKRIERQVTVAERRHDLLNCPASLASKDNREIALGLLIGNNPESTYFQDLVYLWPQATWDQRHQNVDQLLQQTPAIRSEATRQRIAASWPVRFIEPRTAEATGVGGKKKAGVK